MSRRSSVASPIYGKCRPRNDGKTKKNVDLIQNLTKTFIYVYRNDRQALAALGGLTIEVDHMSGVEPQNSGDVIHVDDDSAFSAYRDNAEDSDSSDVER